MTATDQADGLARPPTGGPDPARGPLQAERDFLLRSIADLESEHASGELSDDRYKELLDGYTVRTATVLRAIERLEATDVDPPPGPRRRGRRRAVVAVAALVLGGGGGGLLIRSTADREPGQTISGNAQSGAPDLDTLERVARDRPDDPGAQLDLARALMRADRPVDALQSFDEAARLDPGDPEPQAYAGWIVFLGGLPDEALRRLDAAIAVDPTYPDARFFRGMVLRGQGDAAAALVELREFVRLAPTAAERGQVQRLIADLEQSASTTVPTAAP